MNPYIVIHLIAGTEYHVPLLNSQVFNRAEVLKSNVGMPGAPKGVEVWAIVSMRAFFARKEWQRIASLRKEHPTIRFRVIPGIDRFRKWPAFVITRLIFWLQWNNMKRILHCRGASALEFAQTIKRNSNSVKLVYDVRGADPLEALAKFGIFNTTELSSEFGAIYAKAKRKFSHELKSADAFFTVSQPLGDYIKSFQEHVSEPVIIPCCVSKITDLVNRERVRSAWQLKDEIVVLYLGGTQKYQYLEELVLPFLAALCTLSTNVIPLILTQDEERMVEMIKKSDLNNHQFMVKTVAQNEVSELISAADLGLILRAQSEMNSVAQPVKFAEYLAAGLGVVVNVGTGIIPAIVQQEQVGVSVILSTEKNDFLDQAEKVLEWYRLNSVGLKKRCLELVQNEYTWEANVFKEIGAYNKLIER